MKLGKKPEKPIDVEKIIQKAVEVILKEAQGSIRAILLFGSHADGTAIWRSDIDICVVFKEEASIREATLFRISVLGQLPDIVDIQVFNTLSLKIQKSIADNHRVLFSTEDFDDISFIKMTRSLFFEYQRKTALT